MPFYPVFPFLLHETRLQRRASSIPLAPRTMLVDGRRIVLPASVVPIDFTELLLKSVLSRWRPQAGFS